MLNNSLTPDNAHKKNLHYGYFPGVWATKEPAQAPTREKIIDLTPRPVPEILPGDKVRVVVGGDTVQTDVGGKKFRVVVGGSEFLFSGQQLLAAKRIIQQGTNPEVLQDCFEVLSGNKAMCSALVQAAVKLAEPH